MVVTINELQRVHFLNRSTTEQVQIVLEGKPRPKFTMRVAVSNKHYLKQDASSIYDTEMWLTGCKKLKALYCWTCVMFVPGTTMWNGKGFRVIRLSKSLLLKAIGVHKTSLRHLNGMLRFHNFLKNNAISIASTNNIQIINVKSNSGVLKRIIDVVCLMISQAHSSYQMNNQCALPCSEDCVQLLGLMELYDNRDFANEAITLVHNSPRIIEDIVTTLANLVRQLIKNQTKLSTFVSLVFSEHRHFMTKSKLSTVVRYVTNGKVCESFLGFTNLDVKKNDIAIRGHIVEVYSELELSNRFLSVSTDGAVTPTSYMNDFIGWLHRFHPAALYVPCHFHDFCFVLQQTLLSEFPLSDCFIFFKKLRSIKNYFELTPSHCDALYSLNSFNNIPNLRNLKLTDSQFLRVLTIHRRDFMRYFCSLCNETGEWTVDVVKAVSFQQFLEVYQTVFLLEMFFHLFERVECLSEMLSSCHPESVFEEEVVNRVIQDLKMYQENEFHNLCTSVSKLVDADKLNTKLPTEIETRKLHQLFLTITNSTIQAVEIRLSCTKNINFIGIFDYDNRDQVVISNYHRKSLADYQTTYFDLSELEVEMNVFMKHGHVFGVRSVTDLLDVFWRENFNSTLKNFYKLAEFTVTLPCKPTCSGNSSVKFDSINSWASFSETPETDCFSLLIIEYNLVEFLKSKIQFYEEVISKLN